jgi:hypothetical protein
LNSVTLHDLLEASVRRGQRRVALQRLMMLQARGECVPDDIRRYREAFRSRVPKRELARMGEVATDWACMVSGRDARWKFPVD